MGGTVPAAMEIPVRTFSDLLTVGLEMLQKTWRPILGPALGASLVYGFTSVVVLGATGALDFFDLVFNDPESLDLMTRDEFWDLVSPVLGGLAITTVAQVVIYAFIALVTHRLVASKIGDETLTGAEAVRFAMKRLPTLLVAYAVAAILVVIGLVVFILPGLWVLGSITMLAPVVAVERVRSVEGIRRSFDLVRGRWWPTVGFVLLVGFASAFAIQIVQLVAVPLLVVGSPGAAIGAAYVFGVLIQGMIAAAVAGMVTVWYVDLRARREVVISADLRSDAPELV